MTAVAALPAGSAIRASAMVDSAAALIGLKDWDGAARTLEDIRRQYPAHPLQADVAPKLALEQGCNPYPAGGFRIVTNTGAEGGQEVHHLHFHVIGGARPWLKG